MNHIFFIALMLAVPTIFTAVHIRFGEKLPLSLLLFGIGCALFSLLIGVDASYRFAGGGDDYTYYKNSLYKFSSWTEWLDFGRITNQEQAGYSQLLTWIGQFVGEDIYARKAFNLALFLCLPTIWYLIGMQLAGPRFAKILFVAVLFCTPLWYYWMFMLKDMVIVLLQSVFLLGATRYFSGTKLISSAILILISTVFLIPFRIYLVVINICVLVVAGLLRLIRRGKLSSKLGQVAVVSSTVIILLTVATNQAALKTLGVSGVSRGLDSASIQQNLDFYERGVNYRTAIDSTYYVKFPVLFVIGETSGFSPKAWREASAKSLRGWLAVPWIVLAVPFFVIGLWHYAKTYVIQNSRISASPASMREYRRFRTVPLEAVFAFLAGYLVLSIITADTTRWRMPAMPAMVLVFALGWLQTNLTQKVMILAGWIFPLMLFLLAFYMMQ